MSPDAILHDPTESELALAVQENLFDLFRAMAQTLPGAEIVEGETLSYHHSFPSNPMFKGVWRTRLPPEQVDEAIGATLDWFAARDAPYLFWWTGPGTSPADLGKRLQERGFRDMAEQQQSLAPGIRQTALGAPGMVADLANMNESVLGEVPAGFTIEEIDDESGLRDFKHVFVESYEVPEWAAQAWVDATLSVGPGKTPWRIYIGYLDGEPVASNMLFCGGGVAGLYAVGTVPAARRKGIGAAITLKPLLDARDLGYHNTVLFSTEMAVGVYRRIGFRLTDVRINRYLWMKP